MDLMMACGLSEALHDALKIFSRYIPSLLKDIQSRLLNEISLVLLGKPYWSPGSSDVTPKKSSHLRDTTTSISETSDFKTIILALNILRTFNFTPHPLSYLVRDIAWKYLEDESVIIRKSAAVTCCLLLVPTFPEKSSINTSQIPMEVLERLLSIAVSDNDASIRGEILLALDNRFDGMLAQSENTKLLFVAVNDEFYSVQDHAMSIIGRLVHKNPGLLNPFFRKTVIQLLSELEYSVIIRQKEESADLLHRVIKVSGELVTPYVESIVKIVLPRASEANPGVAAKSLGVLGELGNVCGAAMKPRLAEVVPVIISALQDQSSQSKREAAVRALGLLVGGTGWVIEPYQKFGNLLTVLINMVKTEQNIAIRKETVKTIGILGALDPYSYKVNVESENVVSDETSNIFTSGPLTDDYFSNVVIDALIKILQNTSLNIHHASAVQALIYIFKTMGLKCVPFLPREKIIPALITMIRKSPTSLQHFHFPQLGILITIIKQHIRNHLPQIISLITDTWETAESIPVLQSSLLSITEIIAKSLPPEELKRLLPTFMPHILRATELDMSEKRTPTLKAMHCLAAMSSALEEHVRLSVPIVVKVFERQDIPLQVRKAAVSAITMMAQKIDFADMASRTLIPLSRLLTEPELHTVTMDCVCTIARKMGKEYLAFSFVVDMAVSKNKVICENYNKLENSLRSDEPISFERDSGFISTSEESFAEMTASKLPVNHHSIKRIIDAAVQPRSGRVEWIEWIQRLGVELLKESPAHPLRACASLAASYPPFARTIFNAAFVSCWNEITKSTRDDMIKGLSAALESPTISPEVLTALLNLAEFMEREADNPLPINISSLANYSMGCHAYAKALHYKELEFIEYTAPATTLPSLPNQPGTPVSASVSTPIIQEIPNDIRTKILDNVEAIITLNDNLQQPDSAEGILEYAQLQYGTDVIRESWYEKLSRWEDGLNAYQRHNTIEQINGHASTAEAIGSASEDNTSTVDYYESEDATLGRMRCLHNLGIWDKMIDELESAPWHTGNLLGTYESSNILNQSHLLLSRASPRSSIMFGISQDVASVVSLSKNVKAELAIASLAASAAWGLERWDTMRKYVSLMAQASTTPDSMFFSAVLAVHDEKITLSREMIEKTRDLLDKELVALVGESYERAYSVVVRLQMLSELEEVIQWKSAPDDLVRLQIKQKWMNRLIGCQRDVEVWQRIMKVRSLVIPAKSDVEMQLRFASMCRKSDRNSLALKVLSGLLDNNSQNFTEMEVISGPPKVIYSCLKYLWHIDSRERAFNQMRELCRSLAERLGVFTALTSEHNVVMTPVEELVHPGTNPQVRGELLRLLSRCYRKLGEWHTPQSSIPNENAISQSLRAHRAAVRCDFRHNKAWRAWGMSQYRAFTFFEQKIPEAERPNLPDVIISSHAIPAIQGFFRSIALSSEGRALQDILRLLTLWFKCGNFSSINDAMMHGIKQVSVETWLQVIPQLIGKIHAPVSDVRRLVHQLLLDVGKSHPQAIVYSLTVAAKAPNVVRKTAANQIIDLLRQHYSALVDQALLISNELIRVAILWHELWNEGIEEFFKLYYEGVDADAMFAPLEQLHTQLDKPETLEEISFNNAFSKELKEALGWFLRYKKTQNQSYLKQSLTVYRKVLRGIIDQLPQLMTLEMPYVSPSLLAVKDLELAIPGSYKIGSPIVRISHLAPTMQVFSSKQRPRKLIIFGSDGKEYQYLLK
ncbi:phosphatidylinositol kinase- protein kinase tor1, partial [Nowakowskiella sp. JEL0078]